MKIAFGFKAHSGWAALVVIGDSFEVVDRRRVELSREAWAKQPYHAAEQLEAAAARKLVHRGIQEARKCAKHEMSAAIKRAETNGEQVVACGVLVGSPMPEWSVDEILAVHFRMHKAEGVLFREVLVDAATDCGLKTKRVPEKDLIDFAVKTLRRRQRDLLDQIGTLGKRAGPPWGRDQKEAALAAMIALQVSDEL